MAKKLLTQLTICSILLLSGLSFTAHSSETVYKWKDAQGRVYYGSKPPIHHDQYEIIKNGKKKNSKKSKSHHKKKTKKLEKNKKSSAENTQIEAENNQAKAEYDQQMKAYCSSLRARLGTLESGIRVQIKNDAGENVILGESAKQTEINSLKSKLSKDCQ